MNSRSCYEVEGYVAFFNGVMEIKVSSYKYNSNLHVTYNVEDFVTKEISSQEELLNDLLPLKTNNAGYNVNKIVRMNDLSFLSFYNSAGSYLFIDKNGKIIPVYTFNNKDSFNISSTNLMTVIAVETMYKNRPSLRLLSVDYDDEKEKNDFDFVNDVIEVSDFSSFANIGFSSDDNYRKSELSIYKADVYVSSYAYDKYTINTSYYSYKESGHTYYTTGNSQVNASKHDSLGVFNENCTYNGYFDDYLIDYCTSEEEVKDCQFTIYFTLAYLDRVDGKNMWRVNVFTDMINKI
jgi:hypothetical protein